MVTTGSRRPLRRKQANNNNPSLILGCKIAQLFDVDINDIFQYEEFLKEESE